MSKYQSSLKSSALFMFVIFQVPVAFAQIFGPQVLAPNASPICQSTYQNYWNCNSPFGNGGGSFEFCNQVNGIWLSSGCLDQLEGGGSLMQQEGERSQVEQKVIAPSNK